MHSVFYGVGAAVIGIIAMSAYKLTTKSVGKDKLLWAIYLVMTAVTVITESEIALKRVSTTPSVIRIRLLTAPG